MPKLANREIHRNAMYAFYCIPQPLANAFPVDSGQISLNVEHESNSFGCHNTPTKQWQIRGGTEREKFPTNDTSQCLAISQLLCLG
jgi:hypothetical protein